MLAKPVTTTSLFNEGSFKLVDLQVSPTNGATGQTGQDHMRASCACESAKMSSLSSMSGDASLISETAG
ncbi:hypothetical protein HDU67_008666, partial [Dinochytrium kinnereticum]